jgi:hypothetical protein
MTMPTDEALSPAAHVELVQAIEATRKESPARRKQIDDFLSSRVWLDVATFCASCAQSNSLRLQPWQPPPCDIGNVAAALENSDETTGYRAAALLRQRMARCGVSRWHPSPAHECDRIEAAQ